MAFGYEYWTVYLPEFNPDSFLLFVHNPAGSTKLRDYSDGTERILGQPKVEHVRHATEWGRTRFEETPHPVTGQDGVLHWRSRIDERNSGYLQTGVITDRTTAALQPVETVPKPRQSSRGRARRGSQRQLQDYVNFNQQAIDRAIISALPVRIQENSPQIRWVSPLARDEFQEYRDAEFLAVLGLDRFARDLACFWPERGPSWDALGILRVSLPNCLPISLLVEAKSHVPEVYGNGCQAGSNSRALIEDSLHAAKNWCRVAQESDWTGSLYQSANRIAHLYFLREIARQPAWLVNLYFLDDPIAPTDDDTWGRALPAIRAELGLNQYPPGVIDVFLPAWEHADDIPDQMRDESILPRTPVAMLADIGRVMHSETQTAAAKRKGMGTASPRPTPDGDSFLAWRHRWSELALYGGPSVPDAGKRIDALISLWKRPVPGNWKRSVDPQLLGARYRRGDVAAPHNGEHRIEFEILQEQFDRVKCFGNRLADGLNAFPLCRDTRGIGRRGNVEADLLLLAEENRMFHLYICEVKHASNDPWYAAVESLRQLRLFVESEEAKQIFTHRGVCGRLPAEIAVAALVLAPDSFYRARGRNRNAVPPVCQLISRFQSEIDVDLRLSVWYPAESAIRYFSLLTSR